MLIKLYEMDLRQISTSDFSEHKYLGETEEFEATKGIYAIAGNMYIINSFSSDGPDITSYLLEKIDVRDSENACSNEDLWKCPACGFEDEDTGHLKERYDAYECPICGALTSYEADITVFYNVNLERAPRINQVYLLG